MSICKSNAKTGLQISFCNEFGQRPVFAIRLDIFKKAFESYGVKTDCKNWLEQFLQSGISEAQLQKLVEAVFADS
jgi:hypothetical protein